MNRRILHRLIASTALLPLLVAPGAHAELAVKDGELIAFLGDSITKFGSATPVGWVNLVIDGLKRVGIDAKAINAGFPGDTSANMLARLQPVIDRRPSWLVLSGGVNDVYLAPRRGVPLAGFRINVAQIVQRVRAAGIRVMILSATMLGEDSATPDNRRIEEYNDVLHEIAKREQCLFADVHADMQRELTALERTGRPRGHLLTTSGAHLNPHGNMMMAAGVLRAFGMDDPSLERVKTAWLDIPGAGMLSVPLTVRQLDALQARAAQKGTTVQKLLQPTLDQSVVEFLAR